MSRIVRQQAWLAVLACLGMLIPAPAVQAADVAHPADAAALASRTVDVALDKAGTLRGQVVDAGGAPVAEVPVVVLQGNREVARTVTDRSGSFAVSGLRGGTYQLAAAGGASVYRLWAADTAPPAARPAALLVAAGDQLVRQQDPLLQWISGNPWFAIGLAATAIAVPIAVHKSSNSGPASPP